MTTNNHVTTKPNWQQIVLDNLSTILLLAAIAVGSAVGLVLPNTAGAFDSTVDTTILLLISLLFFEVKLRDFVAAFKNLRFIGIAWAANFLIIPIVGFAVASMFLSGQSLLFTGLLIYFFAPCTDWFLSFTKMARGDSALGTALIPINMVTQVLLFPVWLLLFARHVDVINFAALPDLLIFWFLVPFAAAQIVRFALQKTLRKAHFERISSIVGASIPWVTAALIFQLFVVNVGVMAEHSSAFGIILAALFVFFLATYLLGMGLSQMFKLEYPQHALLTMTMAARNAPLMLAMTAIAIPDQPLVYAALIMGMLVEFPHLTALKHVLVRSHKR